MLFLDILAGLLEFMSLVGPIAAAIPPLLLAFASGPLAALWVLLAYSGIHQIESHLLEPLVMEEAVSLHPAVVVTAVTVVGAAFGVSWAPYSRSRRPWWRHPRRGAMVRAARR